MSKTFGVIVEEILSDVQGFTVSSDQLTSLTNSLDGSQTSFIVDDVSVLSSGIIEVGDEMMWVKSLDRGSNTVSLLPKGRAWAGSTAQTHGVGDTVEASPAYPRFRVKTAVNDQIQELFPSLYSVSSTEFAFNDSIRVGWGIPAEAVMILDVRWKDPANNWQRIRGWEVERGANLTDFPTGVTLRITQRALNFGSTIRVVYAKRPAPLVAETDSFSVTGFEDQIADLVILGVMARLLPMLDVGRLQITHASADELDQPKPIGTAIGIADKFAARYKQRLVMEQMALQHKYPARVHLVR